MEQELKRLRELDREVTLLNHSAALLGWDQETYMPEKAIDERAEQLAVIGGLVHEKVTDPETGDYLEKLGADDANPRGGENLSDLDRDFIRAVYRRYVKSVRLPKRLVTEMSRETSISQSVWVQARKNNDFSKFAPHLEKLIMLNREKADLLGYEDHPYDALLDEYEPWMKTAEVRAVFDALEPKLKAIVEKVLNAPEIDESFLLKLYPVDRQEAFGKTVLQGMQYDFSRGRLDISAHPFTTTLGGDDVRITTRYQENFFKTGIFGIIHECGHALYELGIDDDLKQSILADGASLGIHESQSRFWENIIGRSLPFWRYYYPKLQETFPENLRDVPLENYYRAVNKVEPSLIRIEADEVTYSLHIILRFRLELALISGELNVGDLPDAWVSESERLLGVKPKDYAEGVLQDIHWSMGAFGYFPTYALGNLYGAQFYAAMRKEISDLDTALEEGKLEVPLNWLRENIHRYGARFTPQELCRKVTGEDLNPDYFVSYLTEREHRVYGI